MKELALKYGCNPNQKPSRLFMEDGSDLPVTVLNGRPGYINFMDAFNSYQLVKELKEATGLPAAASFKHVSPAGAAVGLPLSEVEKQIYFVEDTQELSPIACAYIRARGADRLCSYGDWAALSDVCDAATASYLKAEVSDGIIAPGYTEEALAILKTKKKGSYNVIQIDPDYVPDPLERRRIYGVTFEQGRNNLKITKDDLNNIVSHNAIDVYTSDEYEDVLAEGVWQQTFKVKPEVLTAEEKKAWIAQQSGVSCGSDAFFPFGDNVERAKKSGVSYIAEPGGSIRDDNVIAACDKHGIVLCFTGNRLFHH